MKGISRKVEDDWGWVRGSVVEQGVVFDGLNEDLSKVKGLCE